MNNPKKKLTKYKGTKIDRRGGKAAEEGPPMKKRQKEALRKLWIKRRGG